MTLGEYTFDVSRVYRVVDGDTFDLRVERDLVPSPGFGFGIRAYHDARFRLVGPAGAWTDAIERNQPQGSEAMEQSRWWLERVAATYDLRGRTYKPAGMMPDGQFGRWLIDLYDTRTGQHLSDYLASMGLTK